MTDDLRPFLDRLDAVLAECDEQDHAPLDELPRIATFRVPREMVEANPVDPIAVAAAEHTARIDQATNGPAVIDVDEAWRQLHTTPETKTSWPPPDAARRPRRIFWPWTRT